MTSFYINEKRAVQRTEQGAITQEITKTITENGTYTYTQDEGYDGISKATIIANKQLPMSELTITQRPSLSRQYRPPTGEGFSKVTASCPLNIETREVNITQPGTTVIQTSDGYDSMDNMIVKTNIPDTRTSESFTPTTTDEYIILINEATLLKSYTIDFRQVGYNSSGQTKLWINHIRGPILGLEIKTMQKLRQYPITVYPTGNDSYVRFMYLEPNGRLTVGINASITIPANTWGGAISEDHEPNRNNLSAITIMRTDFNSTPQNENEVYRWHFPDIGTNTIDLSLNFRLITNETTTIN